MVNSSALVFPVMPTSGGIPTFVAYSATYYAAVLLLYRLFGPRPILVATASHQAGRAEEAA